MTVQHRLLITSGTNDTTQKRGSIWNDTQIQTRLFLIYGPSPILGVIILNSREGVVESIEQLWTFLSPHARRIELKKKQTIIQEGTISDAIYYVQSGCLRSWFNHDGKDVSFQFFLDGSIIASFESFMFDDQSPYTVESILPTTVYVIPKDVFKAKIGESDILKDAVMRLVCERLRHYQRLFLSRIKDSPQERYEELTKTHPELIRRVPQHYIASYLGITSVSLSRIRCRK